MNFIVIAERNSNLVSLNCHKQSNCGCTQLPSHVEQPFFYFTGLSLIVTASSILPVLFLHGIRRGIVLSFDAWKSTKTQLRSYHHNFKFAVNSNHRKPVIVNLYECYYVYVPLYLVSEWQGPVTPSL
jgi:hypothetical protein